jgi:hypothetical protein
MNLTAGIYYVGRTVENCNLNQFQLTPRLTSKPFEWQEMKLFPNETK